MPSPLEQMYAGDDEDLGAAYASLPQYATPQATPQNMSPAAADLKWSKPAGAMTPGDLRTLGRNQRIESDQNIERQRQDAGARFKSNLSTLMADQSGTVNKRAIQYQPLPNVPVAQLKPGRYALEGVPGAEAIMKRGARGIVVRPDGRIVIVGLDGRNVDLSELQAQGQPGATSDQDVSRAQQALPGGQGGPDVQPQAPGQKIVMPLRRRMQ